MRAVVQDRYGEAEDVLREEQIHRPEIGDSEVLVRVHAAGVDRGVWHLMTGLAYPVRLAGYGARAPKTRVRGSDLAGVVEAVGTDVTTLHPGDAVFGYGIGSFAEYAAAPEAKLAQKPENLTFVQAAAVPVSGLTALQALRDHARVRPGQRVLVIGASGGVGTFAVQIAKAFGAEVTGVCSTAKIDLVRSIGADHVIDYQTDDALTCGDQRYDVILDTGGHRSLRQLRRALTSQGTLVLVGSETGGRWLGGMDRLLRAMALSPFVGQQLRGFMNSENAADLVVLADLIESGAVTPAVDRTYPLGEAPAAVARVRDGQARGKVVIDLERRA
ncbi:NADPH:quinone reductase [Geodermatophilus amargosae]|uniref:NADPH:quinone reductase n=2 Tax=Geodermatophilus amargosae TaxID=1296565 RepID=A0A1I7CVF1_9ACTN|nr:NADPH:quinone reductase [Geodermatophilus amargosae]